MTVRTATTSTPRRASGPIAAVAPPPSSWAACSAVSRSVPAGPGASTSSGAGNQVSRTVPSEARVARPAATAPVVREAESVMEENLTWAGWSGRTASHVPGAASGDQPSQGGARVLLVVGTARQQHLEADSVHQGEQGAGRERVGAPAQQRRGVLGPLRGDGAQRG